MIFKENDITCSIESTKLMEILTNSKTLPKFFPPLFQSRILEKNENNTIFEETIIIPKFKIRLVQKSIYNQIESNIFRIKIISGPIKGTIVTFNFESIHKGTKIHIDYNFCIGLKYRIFKKIIEKKYTNTISIFINQIIAMSTITSENKWNTSIIDNGNGIILSIKNFPPLKFFGWEYSDLKGIFVDETYNLLSVCDKIVIDIGANIADSSIYFAVKGAKKVIGVEPFLTNFEIAKKNISINKLSDRIQFLHAGISDRSGEIFIDSNVENGYTSFHLIEHKNGQKIQTITLEDLINKFNIQSAVLKLDCEGCEYAAILTSSQKILQIFSEIFIEYHDGYANLKEKLENSGFTVIVLDSNQSQGFLIAKL